MMIKIVSMLLAAGSLFGASTGASAAFLKVSCDDFSNSGASMWVRYIDSVERQTLDVVLKMPMTQKNLAKTNRRVLIGVQNIGQITLTPNDEGMMSGSLSYGSYADTGQANPQMLAFPRIWTGAVSGTTVRTAGLACELRY